MNTEKNELTWCFVVPRLTTVDDTTYVFPIGTGYVCSYLKSQGRHVETLNMNYKKESVKELLENMFQQKKIDVLAMGGLTVQYSQMAEIFRIAKSVSSKVICVAGGHYHL